MFYAVDPPSIFDSSSSLCGAMTKVPPINTGIVMSSMSQRSPTTSTGRTSSNGDSEAEEFAIVNKYSIDQNIGGLHHPMYRSPNEPHSNSIAGGPWNFDEDNTGRRIVGSRMDQRGLNVESQTGVFNMPHQQDGFQRPFSINQFYAPRNVQNTPVYPRGVDTKGLPPSYSSRSITGQPSQSALNFQLQMRQQMPGQSMASTTIDSSHALGGMSRPIFQVQFKCSIRFFVLAPGAPETIGVGDFVIVEADRGEDLGMVVDVMTMRSFIDRKILSKAAESEDDDASTIGKILRPATLVERQNLPEKYHIEAAILQVCRELAYNTYKLPLQIHEVEYQFDRHKLTVFYTSDGRVDFREMVRDLFSVYKARIWMKKLDVSRRGEFQSFASSSLASGLQTSFTQPAEPQPQQPLLKLPQSTAQVPVQFRLHANQQQQQQHNHNAYQHQHVHQHQQYHGSSSSLLLSNHSPSPSLELFSPQQHQLQQQQSSDSVRYTQHSMMNVFQQQQLHSASIAPNSLFQDKSVLMNHNQQPGMFHTNTAAGHGGAPVSSFVEAAEFRFPFTGLRD